jgi:hypothetical protein
MQLGDGSRIDRAPQIGELAADSIRLDLVRAT